MHTLDFGILQIWHQDNLCRMFGSILAFCPLDASSTYLIQQHKLSPGIVPRLSGDHVLL